MTMNKCTKLENPKRNTTVSPLLMYEIQLKNQTPSDGQWLTCHSMFNSKLKNALKLHPRQNLRTHSDFSSPSELSPLSSSVPSHLGQ